MRRRKYKRLTFIFLLGFVISIVGFITSFRMYQKDDVILPEKKKEEGIVFLNVNNNKSIYLDGVIPTLDRFGILSDPFNFSIQNMDNDTNYILKLVDDNSTVLNKHLRYQLIKNEEDKGVLTLNEEGIIDIGKIAKDEKIDYTLRLWLSFDSEIKKGEVKKYLQISSDSIKLDTSKANAPLLVSGMIPVYYDEEKEAFCKSDTINTFNNEWYNYDKKIWANAVTVSQNKRAEIIDSPIGTEINMEDINALWVWIPRFKYQKENGTVTFVKKEEDAYSAFTFDNIPQSGFWISKFEAGLKSDNACITTSMTNKCNNSNNPIYFKPNLPVTNKITMANLFYSFRKMELKNNIYGFLGNGTKLNSDGTIPKDDNNLDIHMIRNSEWQAVSILSDSKYGINEKIVPNNSLETGKAYLDKKTYNYNILDSGTKASTTGNIYGVYDMSGGKREYVMVGSNLFDKKSNSGFTTKVQEKYYDQEIDEMTTLFKNKYDGEYELGDNPYARGGYLNRKGSIYSLYSVSDYINKISNETNSRAVITVNLGGNDGKEKES